MGEKGIPNCKMILWEKLRIKGTSKERNWGNLGDRRFRHVLGWWRRNKDVWFSLKCSEAWGEEIFATYKTLGSHQRIRKEEWSTRWLKATMTAEERQDWWSPEAAAERLMKRRWEEIGGIEFKAVTGLRRKESAIKKERKFKCGWINRSVICYNLKSQWFCDSLTNYIWQVESIKLVLLDILVSSQVFWFVLSTFKYCEKLSMSNIVVFGRLWKTKQQDLS